MPPKKKNELYSVAEREASPQHFTISFRQVLNLMWGNYPKYQHLIAFCQAFRAEQSAELGRLIETNWVNHPGLRMWAYLSAGRRRNVTSDAWPDQARQQPPPYPQLDCLYFNRGVPCTKDHEPQHICFCCGGHHPLIVQSLESTVGADPKTIRCQVFRTISAQFATLIAQVAPLTAEALEKCLDGRTPDFVSTKSELQPKLLADSDSEADDGDQQSGKPNVAKVTLKATAALNEMKRTPQSYTNIRNFCTIFRHQDTQQLAGETILPLWAEKFDTLAQPRMWAFFSAARRRNLSLWKDPAEDNPPNFDCLFFNHNRCTKPAEHDALGVHHCMCCGARHPLRYESLTDAAFAVPNSIQCPKLSLIVKEFKLLAKRLGVRPEDRGDLEYCLTAESEEFQAYQVQPLSQSKIKLPDSLSSSLSSVPDSPGKQRWPAEAVKSTPGPVLSPAAETHGNLSHRHDLDSTEGKRIGTMSFAKLNFLMKEEETKFRYLLCFSNMFRERELVDFTNGKILIGWEKIQCRCKPRMWAFFTAARRRQLTVWKDEAKYPSKLDCLNYNCGYCSNQSAEHENMHICMCCGGKHMLRYESLSEAAADAANIRCPVIKTLVKQLEVLELKVNPVSRESLEACLQGASPDFEFWQPVQVSRKGATKPVPSTTSSVPAQQTVASADSPPADEKAPRSPNASEDSLHLETVPQEYLPGPLPTRCSSAGVTLAPASAIDTFKTYFQNAREKQVRHEFIWYPEQLELGRPFTIWCKGACCSLSSDEHRHELSEGYFWDKANPYSVGGARAVVVKQYRIKGKGSADSTAGYEREVETFEQVYATELLEWKAPYRFQGGEAFSFLVLRKHDDDLSKILADNPPLEERLSLIQKVLLVFREAHMYGLIHGDVKPGNIVREALSDGVDTATNVGQSQSYNLKLIDFEFASFESPETGAPPSSTVKGLTRLWGSPDQHNGFKALQTDDCWSLALVLYEIYHYRPRTAEEQRHGAPLFFLDAHAELPEDTDELFLPWVQWEMMAISRKRSLSMIPFPKKCNGLLRSLMEQLFRYALSRNPKETTSRAEHPLTYSDGAPHMLFVDSEKLCILLLHLQHRFANRTPPYDALLLNCRVMTEPKAWLENLSAKLISVIQQYDENFTRSLKLDAAEALRYLRNLLAHPDDPTSVLMCHFIDNAGELLAELQAQLTAARITFDLRRTCLRIPNIGPPPIAPN